jgi:transaldolase
MSADALTPLQRLSALGQSVWVDYLSRDSIRGGHLQELIDDYAVVGATSNPTIFQKAMGAGRLRRADARAGRGRRTRGDLLGAGAAGHRGRLRPLPPGMGRSGSGRDGYVSLEVDPRLAYDTLETFREAMRLHKEVDRPNLMVKIPATKPGLAAIEDVISKGHSINVTLIFSLQRYAEVAESYMRGLERLIAEGGDPTTVASVASFFVSRIDTEADRRLDEIGGDADELKGKLAIANAKLAYRHYLEVFSGPRWEYLAGKGATPQRVLWASTSTKNPAYADTSTSRSCSARTPSTRCPRRRSWPTRTTAARSAADETAWTRRDGYSSD